MKKLTKFAVQSVMDLLIHTNGQTTTLEIKNQLRELEYRADQDKVHEIVEEIYNKYDHGTYKYDRNVVNSKYNTYSFSETFLDENPEYDTKDKTHITQVATDNSASMIGNATTTKTPVSQPFTTKNSTITAPSTLSKGPASLNLVNPVINLRDPLFIFYTENHAKKSGTDSQNWVVYHRNGNSEIQIFDKTLTRDTVRSRYSSIMKVKIQDVRSCKFQNY